MRAVENDEEWALVSPKDDTHRSAVLSARSLWIRLLTARVETGEPYFIFIDHVNRRRPGASQACRARRSRCRTCAARSRCRPAPTRTARNAPPSAACHRSIVETFLEWKDRSPVYRGCDAFPRQRVAGFHRQGAGIHVARGLCGDARTIGRARRDGVPLVPAVPEACRSNR